MRREIACTQEQMAKLLELIRHGRAVLSARQRRRLQMTEQLLLGRKGTEIAGSMVPKVTPQAVNRLKQELLDVGGVDAMLTETEDAIRRRHGNRKAPRRQRGRPGYASWEDLEKRVIVDDEPTIEIASVYLSSNVQYAVLAVRNSSLVDETIRAHAEGEPLQAPLEPCLCARLDG